MDLKNDYFNRYQTLCTFQDLLLIRSVWRLPRKWASERPWEGTERSQSSSFSSGSWRKRMKCPGTNRPGIYCPETNCPGGVFAGRPSSLYWTFRSFYSPSIFDIFFALHRVSHCKDFIFKEIARKCLSFWHFFHELTLKRGTDTPKTRMLNFSA